MDISSTKQAKSHTTWMWLRKGNCKRQTESFLMEEQK